MSAKQKYICQKPFLPSVLLKTVNSGNQVHQAI